LVRTTRRFKRLMRNEIRVIAGGGKPTAQARANNA
jgi:hypothetical protein